MAKKIQYILKISCGIIFIIFPAISYSKPIVADLALHSVDIDHNFRGMDILLFGVKNDAGRLVVVLRGPTRDYVVRKKERIAGIWVNRKSMEFKNVNSLYFVSATGELAYIKNNHLLSSLNIGLSNIEIIPELGDPETDKFKEALVRYKQSNNLYVKNPEEVSFWEETLFRTKLKFPKNIEGGVYTAEVYLFNDGLLTSMQSTPIKVSKIGFEAFMSELAHRFSLFYGVLCVAMALAAGWAASAIFSRI